MSTRLLIIEDDSVVRLMLSELCAGPDVVVEQAKSLRDALELMRANAPDVVFLDLFLPDCNSHSDLLVGYRQIAQEFPKASVVIITAHTPIADAPVGVPVLAKPPNVSDIRLAMQQATADAILRRTRKELVAKLEQAAPIEESKP